MFSIHLSHKTFAKLTGGYVSVNFYKRYKKKIVIQSNSEAENITTFLINTFGPLESCNHIVDGFRCYIRVIIFF